MTRELRQVLAQPAPMAGRALGWVRANHLPTGGIRLESGHPHAYPKVTGYLIPTLLAYGERELAAELADWLMCSQRADGSFTDPHEGRSSAFDSGQVLRGLVAMIGVVPGVDDAARRAGEYLCWLAGRGRFPRAYNGSDRPESIHLYALPPLLEAAEKLGIRKFRDAASALFDRYAAGDDCCRIGDLTHDLGYQLEALIDLGAADRARPILDRLESVQRPDGGVRGREGVDWICSTGLAQVAICWYKIGRTAPADAAMDWLERHQEPTGGFRGSYGPGASYKPHVEISWAVKFALDAQLHRVNAFFASHASEFPTDVAPTDGRLQAVLARISNGDRVLEVGCGKGRFLRAIAEARQVECHGIDPSRALLASAASGASTQPGTLERIPYPDAAFDVVYAVEALEHSVAWDNAVRELTRVVKPGGWAVIVDKHAGAWGRMDCPSWVRWPAADELAAALRRHCDGVSVAPVAYDDRPAADGLMMAWSGRRRRRLSGEEWSEVLGIGNLQRTIAHEVRFNQFSDWGRAVMRQTRPDDHVLEIGSGAGKISLQLAMAGRRATCLDSSAASLAFVAGCARDLGVELRTVRADATMRLPFANRTFDCVWSSGLLQHFTTEERRRMLTEWARVSRRFMIHLVPNAASLAYRFGKAAQESRGDWRYGLELPLATLRDDFEAAGIRVTAETTVAAEHALGFVDDPAVRRTLREAIGSISRADLAEWRQGYLLVTVGDVRL